MADFSAADSEHMARALRLARLGWYTAHPNPRVGCVLVRDGEVVGEGWHAVAGEAHAEINALRMAGERARGSTAYVTLEPCAHHGKTAPCADALLGAGIARVVAAMQDPFADVAGQGFARLADGGVEVETGLLETEARLLNEGFLSRIERGRPLLRLKIAASLDGATAMATGESHWITGPEARRDVQRFRAASGAIMTGSGTVLADDPALTVRDEGLGERQPLRVVLDSRLRTPATAKMLRSDGETLIFCTDDQRRGPLEAAGAVVQKLGAGSGGLDLGEVLRILGERGINDLLVEAGPLLSGALLEAGLVDELVIYQAPHIMGSQVRPMFATPGWIRLENRRSLRITDLRAVGRDIRITARFSPSIVSGRPRGQG